MSGRRSLFLVSCAILATSFLACGGSPEDERAALCEDLTSLGATIELIANPPVDATAGEIRGAVEKLDPTFEQARDGDVVPEAEAEGLRADQEAALEALGGIGDDTPIVEVPPERLAPTDVLVARSRDLTVFLGCGVAD